MKLVYQMEFRRQVVLTVSRPRRQERRIEWNLGKAHELLLCPFLSGLMYGIGRRKIYEFDKDEIHRVAAAISEMTGVGKPCEG